MSYQTETLMRVSIYLRGEIASAHRHFAALDPDKVGPAETQACLDMIGYLQTCSAICEAALLAEQSSSKEVKDLLGVIRLYIASEFKKLGK